MLIQHKDRKTDMAQPKINAENNSSSKLSQIIMGVKCFYNKHFPTDSKTYSLRVAAVGLILSILAVHLIITRLVPYWFFVHDSRNYVVLFCYLFIATAVGYELSYGLKIGDRKHYTPWILFKLVEVCLVFITIICILVDSYYVGDIIYGFSVLGLLSASTLYVMSASWKQFRESPPDTETEVNDNISDTSAPV